MPALALLLGIAGLTSVGTAAGTFRATFNSPNAEQPKYGPFSLTTWEILLGIGGLAFLGPVGAAVGAGLAAGGLIARHDTGQVKSAIDALGVTVAQLQAQIQQAQPLALPGPAPVSPVAPGAPGGSPAPQAASFWDAPGQAVRDLWASLWGPNPTPAPAK